MRERVRKALSSVQLEGENKDDTQNGETTTLNRTKGNDGNGVWTRFNTDDVMKSIEELREDISQQVEDLKESVSQKRGCF